MSSNEIASRTRVRLGALALAVTLGLGAAACSSSSKTGAPSSGPSTSAVAGTSVPPNYVGGAAAPTAAVDAIRSYEVKHGPPIGSWTITGVEVSTADPTYVLYRITPAPGQTNVQPGYGFAHREAAKWTVIGFGTDAVGCPHGAGSRSVPAAVLNAFRLSCPG